MNHAQTPRPDERTRYSQSNILKEALSKLSNFDLSDKVYGISPVLCASGGFGDVFTGYIVPEAYNTEVKVAIKRLRVHTLNDAGLQKRVARELYIWSKLNHPNILRLEGFYLEDDQYPSFVSKWMENGTVLEYLNANPDTSHLSVVIGISRGLSHLHRSEIIHADIKPENVMMSESGKPLLCDFGISRMLFVSNTIQFTNTSTGELRGTIRYMSKELLSPMDLEPTTYSKESDVWAFGMTVYTVLTKKQPYHEFRILHQVFAAIIGGRLPSRPNDIDSWTTERQVMWRIIQFCWQPPSDRPSMVAILVELTLLEFRLLESRCTGDLPVNGSAYKLSAIVNKELDSLLIQNPLSIEETCTEDGGCLDQNNGYLHEVRICFRNSGSQRLVLRMFDAELRTISKDIAIPHNFVITKKVRINVPVNFSLVCGRETKNFSRTFIKDADIDLDKFFKD